MLPAFWQVCRKKSGSWRYNLGGYPLLLCEFQTLFVVYFLYFCRWVSKDSPEVIYFRKKETLFINEIDKGT